MLFYLLNLLPVARSKVMVTFERRYRQIDCDMPVKSAMHRNRLRIEST